MQTDPRILFGRRLAEIRCAKGWSQEKFALVSGMAWIVGREHALVNICRLAETLGISPGELMSFETRVNRAIK